MKVKKEDEVSYEEQYFHLYLTMMMIYQEIWYLKDDKMELKQRK